MAVVDVQVRPFRRDSRTEGTMTVLINEHLIIVVVSESIEAQPKASNLAFALLRLAASALIGGLIFSVLWRLGTPSVTTLICCAVHLRSSSTLLTGRRSTTPPTPGRQHRLAVSFDPQELINRMIDLAPAAPLGIHGYHLTSVVIKLGTSDLCG
jgi:hypothetical protein